MILKPVPLRLGHILISVGCARLMVVINLFARRLPSKHWRMMLLEVFVMMCVTALLIWQIVRTMRHLEPSCLTVVAAIIFGFGMVSLVNGILSR